MCSNERAKQLIGTSHHMGPLGAASPPISQALTPAGSLFALPLGATQPPLPCRHRSADMHLQIQCVWFKGERKSTEAAAHDAVA